MSWRRFPVSLKELCIDTTLRCGQSFRWKKSKGGVYSCALQGRIISLKQDRTHLYFRATFPAPLNSPVLSDDVSDDENASSKDDGGDRTPDATYRVTIDGKPVEVSSKDMKRVDTDDGDDTEQFIRHYLNLTPNLERLYEWWALQDKNFFQKAPRFTGVRILQQDAWEALVGFICSSNNNITRISQMMDRLCANYGQLIGEIDGVEFYDMPKPSALVNPQIDAQLRGLGFGYRAKYLHQTAIMIEREEKGWLDSLRNPASPAFHSLNPEDADDDAEDTDEMQCGGREGFRRAREALRELPGVGPKVADCVCLMGLGWLEAVPVDTHVWQIAQRDYGFGRGKRSSGNLTAAMYEAVGDHFRKRWGSEAGWAHSVLFTADLKPFAARLRKTIEEMEEENEEREDDEVEPEETTGPSRELPEFVQTHSIGKGVSQPVNKGPGRECLSIKEISEGEALLRNKMAARGNSPTIARQVEKAAPGPELHTRSNKSSTAMKEKQQGTTVKQEDQVADHLEFIRRKHQELYDDSLADKESSVAFTEDEDGWHHASMPVAKKKSGGRDRKRTPPHVSWAQTPAAKRRRLRSSGQSMFW